MSASPPPRGILAPIAIGFGVGAVGLVVAAALVLGVFGPVPARAVGSPSYLQTTVDVPSNATAAHPMTVPFYGATFVLYYPPPPPPNSTSSGLVGVTITVTEPSGIVDYTGTGCGACGHFTDSWYSADGTVGISYEALSSELGVVTLLVAAPPHP